MAQIGVALDVHSYNIMISGFCKIKMVDEAMKLFEEMHCKQIFPDVVTYNSLIDGLCKSGRISYALKLIGEMHDKGQPPNIITYNSLLDALCKNYHVDKAIELLTKLTTIYNQVCAHTIFLSMDYAKVED